MNLAVPCECFIEEHWHATFLGGEKRMEEVQEFQSELAIYPQANICQNVIFVPIQMIPKLMSNLRNSSSCQREVWRIIFET